MLLKSINGRVTEYIREHWHEWIWTTVSEGYMMPKFYLPVRRTYQGRGWICVIFPLAPFVMAFLMVKYCFLFIWHDVIDLIEDIRRLNAEKRSSKN